MQTKEKVQVAQEPPSLSMSCTHYRIAQWYLDSHQDTVTLNSFSWHELLPSEKLPHLLPRYTFLHVSKAMTEQLESPGDEGGRGCGWQVH